MVASLAVLRCQVRKAFLNVKSLQENTIVYYNNAVKRDVNVAKNVSRAESSLPEYPPIKPRYPPGIWKDMDSSYAWIWQKTIDDLWDISDVKGRQEYILRNEMSHINILPHNDHPNYLEFAKYASKSVLLPWSEFVVNSLHDTLDEDLFDKMKKIITDHLLIEHEAVEREISNKESTLNLKKRRAALVLRNIVDTLLTHLNQKANHLRTCQYDENVIVRAVWDRHGIERKRRHRLSPSSFKIDDVLDQRLTSSCIFNGMIRSHLPLPQVHPRDSGLSTESEKPVLQYKFPCYGVSKLQTSKAQSILAGHILGDPCEYGTVGFLLTNRKEKLSSNLGSKILKECRLARGLTSTFTWLAAQAYNQGFSGFIDLTYPLTSQTVMSDGKNFSFIACQLNTLELWKSDKANEIVNLCWHSDEMPLYDCIENGQVKGFNDEVLQMLVNVFLLEPVERGYDMKPTISDKDTNLHHKCDFIPEKVEEVVEQKVEQYVV